MRPDDDDQDARPEGDTPRRAGDRAPLPTPTPKTPALVRRAATAFALGGALFANACSDQAMPPQQRDMMAPQVTDMKMPQAPDAPQVPDLAPQAPDMTRPADDAAKADGNIPPQPAPVDAGQG